MPFAWLIDCGARTTDDDGRALRARANVDVDENDDGVCMVEGGGGGGGRRRKKKKKKTTKIGSLRTLVATHQGQKWESNGDSDAEISV